MATLVELMEKCEEDTRKMVSIQAAIRLMNWRKYKKDSAMLVQYIQRVIRNNRKNGWILEKCGGLSLERIVINHHPEQFTEEDITVARTNLGLSPAKELI